MKKTTKTIVGIVVVVAAVIVVFAFIFERAEAPENINQSIPMNWITYADAVSGINLQAPAGLVVVTSSSGLSLIFATTTPYVHTHLLHELRIDIATPAVDCVSTESGLFATSTSTEINGVNFERQSWGEAAAGSLYQGVDYTALRNNLCYRISLFTHSTDGEGFYTGDQVQIKTVDAQQAIDIKNLFSLFDQVAGTIKFTK